MKITYNYWQNFELKEIDMYCKNVIFIMNDENNSTEIKVPFESIYELQNIPKLLDDFLIKNDLID